MRSGQRAPIVLILGGTVEARELATALDGAGIPVITALAGRTTVPRLPVGQVRSGGFDGPDGLADWLAANNDVSAVVDATHPFATRISASARAACARAGVPLLRLERPEWHPEPGDLWHRVDDLREAADLVAQVGQRAWLTIGRQGVGVFASVDSCWFLIRCIELPHPPLPERHELLLDRGPYTLDGELALIDRHRIDVLVSKESGGAATEAKLEAARLRRIPVIMVRRPATSGGRSVATVPEAIDWVRSVMEDEAVKTARSRSR